MSANAYLRKTSPIGPLLIAASDRGLRALLMQDQRHLGDRPGVDWVVEADASDAQRDLLRRASTQLDEYFAGGRVAFDLPLDLAGTDFQRSVWQGLRSIAFGETISYGELARRIGNPKAVRAVGLANGRNPVSIVVPCHRVIGADGSMTGYGGGIDRKVFLLGLETRTVGTARAGQLSLV